MDNLEPSTNSTDDYPEPQSQAHAERLSADLGKAQLLVRDCLIHVTRFFRDAEAFSRLRQEIGTMLAGKAQDKTPLRVWVAGCSTGEEPYSVAMVIERAMRETGCALDYKIFATDVDERALTVASKGTYDYSVLEDVPSQDRDRYFRKEGSRVVIEPNIRRRILFANHNLLNDPPFTRCDLVICRNLLIYFDSEAQKIALDRLLFSTRTGGLLLLGPSETADSVASCLKTIDNKWRLHTKIQEPRPNATGRVFGGLSGPELRTLRPKQEVAENPLNRACEALISQLAEAGIVVTEAGHVVYTFGDVGACLSINAGHMSTKLNDLLPRELQANVAMAIRHGRATGQPVSVSALTTAEGQETPNLDVVHVPAIGALPPYDVLLVGRATAPPRPTRPGGDLDLDEAEGMDITAVEALERKQAKLLRWLEATSSDIFFVCDAESMCMLHVSPSFERIWGYAVDECLSDPMAWLRSIHEEDRDRVKTAFSAKTPSEYNLEYRVIRPDGGVRMIRTRIYDVVESGFGVHARVRVGIASNVTQATQDEVGRRRLEVHRVANESSGLPMAFLDEAGLVQWSNKAARELLGPDVVSGSVPFVATLDDPSTRGMVADSIRDALAAPGTGCRRHEVSLTVKNGHRLPVDLAISRVGAIAGDSGPRANVTWVDRQTTEVRERELLARTESLAAEAQRDPLTGLINRRGVERRLEHELSVCKRSGDPCMVLLIDLDKFKIINDEHSHAVGDTVLVEAAKRMSEHIRPSDVLARIGGDEFLALLPNTRLAEAAHVAERLRRSVAAYDISGLDVTVSIGVSVAPPRASTVTELVGRSSAILKQAKETGRNRVSFCTGEGKGALLDYIERMLDQLLVSNDIRVVHQTINRLSSGEMVGYELLVRGPEKVPTPDHLFGLARSLGRVHEMDLACLGQTLKRAGELANGMRVHVNLMPRTLRASEGSPLLDMLAQVPRPGSVCLEISEQEFIGSCEGIREGISAVRDMGFLIGLDDIGFGRTSLESLIAIDPEIAKIDRSLITGISKDEGQRRSLSRLVYMLSGSHSTIVAEGVESEGDRQVLEDMGIEYAQGFLWSLPED